MRTAQAVVEEVTVKNLVYRDFYENILKCPDTKFEMERIEIVFYKTYEQHYEACKRKYVLR